MLTVALVLVVSAVPGPAQAGTGPGAAAGVALPGQAWPAALPGASVLQAAVDQVSAAPESAGVPSRPARSWVAGTASGPGPTGLFSAATVAPGISSAAAVQPVSAAALPVTFSRTGFTPRPAVLSELPYIRRSPVPLVDTGVHDAAGVRLALVNGLLYNHPVAQASYGLDLLESYRITNNPVYLDRARAQANRLVSRRVVSGTAWFYPYPFDFALHGNPREMMRAPWYSGMAQGMALSLFVRLSQVTADPAWTAAANATFASFQVAPSATAPWVSRVDTANHLWIEEYARWPVAGADRTINGFQFAAMGLYEYASLTNSPAAWTLWDGALTSLAIATRAALQPGWASLYCLQHRVISNTYHLLVANLSTFLERESGSSTFGRLTDQLVDAYPPPVVATLRVTMMPGVVTAYRYSATGVVTARRSLTLAQVSEAAADSRARLFPGGPIGYRMTTGYFAGYYLTERAGAVYAPGRFVHTDYLPARTATMAAGSRLGGARLSPAGGTLASLTVIFATADSATFDASETVNGRRWTHLTSGPLTDYWVPTAGITPD